MSDSPFLPPRDAIDEDGGSWTFLVARMGVAAGVAAYSLFLFSLGALPLLAHANSHPNVAFIADGALPELLAMVALCVGGIVGVGAAVMHVLFRDLALRVLLVSAGVAWVAVFPLAVVNATVGESPAGAARMVAVGSLGPMLCLMAYGGLLSLQPHVSSANGAVGT